MDMSEQDRSCGCSASKHSVCFRHGQMLDGRVVLSGLDDIGRDVGGSKIERKVAMYQQMVDELGQCFVTRQTKLFKLIRRDIDRKLKLTSDGLGAEFEVSHSSGE